MWLPVLLVLVKTPPPGRRMLLIDGAQVPSAISFPSWSPSRVEAVERPFTMSDYRLTLGAAAAAAAILLSATAAAAAASDAASMSAGELAALVSATPTVLSPVVAAVCGTPTALRVGTVLWVPNGEPPVDAGPSLVRMPTTLLQSASPTESPTASPTASSDKPALAVAPAHEREK